MEVDNEVFLDTNSVLLKLFRTFDIDKKEKLTVKQTVAALKCIGIERKDSELKAFGFTEKRKRVSFERFAFVTALILKEGGTVFDEIAYDCFDKERKGRIEKEDVKELIQKYSLEEQFDEKTVGEMIEIWSTGENRQSKSLTKQGFMDLLALHDKIFK